MDGAEGLNGVFVLAATSRPDMIDPALLRPGRLDKSIFVDFPDENDRLDIIRKITQKIPLDHSISKLMIAQKTEGFSGADLQALLYTAQLAAINEELRNSQIIVDVPKELKFKILQGDIALIDTKNLLIHEEKGYIQRDPTDSKPVIVSNLHLQSAFKATAPSLRASELSKYQLIFERFENKRVGPHDVGKKSTFA